MKGKLIALGMMVIVALVLMACGRGQQSGETAKADEQVLESEAADAQTKEERDHAKKSAPAVPEYRIVTLLPPDAIPAIDNPQFLSVAEADDEYEAQEFVLGVEIDGDARAYSIPFLSGHEIVNDVVGGVPIAVTW